MKNLAQRVHEVYQQGMVEQWSYPQLFDALKKAGVCHYVVDVANLTITYTGVSETFSEAVHGASVVEIGSVFHEAEITQAIRRSQRREINYPTFLKEIATAGVPSYRVDMSECTVSYFGSNPQNNKYVEKVPTVG